MEQRDKGKPSQERAKAIATKLVEAYKAHSPEPLTSTHERVVDMLMKLDGAEIGELGIMRLKKVGDEHYKVNDLTSFADVVGGNHIFEFTDMADPDVYAFARLIHEEVIALLQS